MTLSISNNSSSSHLEQLIDEINFQRAKELHQLLKDECGFVVVHGTTHWTDLFVRYFLFESDSAVNVQERDDLLFFIRKRHHRQANKFSARFNVSVDVFRSNSRRLPIGDPEIDWQETLYTNLVIHRFHYYVTLAVCTRTSARQLQILRRHTERVWASPSIRSMSDKGTCEQITYPNICFMLDNFEEAFSELVVRDGETVAVELVARDTTGSCSGVIFLGSVRYEPLKRVYDARASAASRMAYRMSFGLLSSSSAAAASTSRRLEFVRLNGPCDVGHAEMALAKPSGVLTCDTPVSEPGCSLTDRLSDWDPACTGADLYCHQDTASDCGHDSDAVPLARCRSHQRRSSDPSATLQSFLYGKNNINSSSRNTNRNCTDVISNINTNSDHNNQQQQQRASSIGLGRARSQCDGINSEGGGGGSGGGVGGGGGVVFGAGAVAAEIQSGDLRDDCVASVSDQPNGRQWPCRPPTLTSHLRHTCRMCDTVDYHHHQQQRQQQRQLCHRSEWACRSRCQSKLFVSKSERPVDGSGGGSVGGGSGSCSGGTGDGKGGGRGGSGVDGTGTVFSAFACCTDTLYRWLYPASCTPPTSSTPLFSCSSSPQFVSATAAAAADDDDDVKPLELQRLDSKSVVGLAKLNDGHYNPSWSTAGHWHAVHCWKEWRGRSRAGAGGGGGGGSSLPPLQVMLTYVTVPCTAIVEGLLNKDSRQTPILTF